MQSPRDYLSLSCPLVSSMYVSLFTASLRMLLLGEKTNVTKGTIS